MSLLIIGRMKGLTTIVALGFTGAAVFAVYIPAILSGRNVYTVTIVITVFIIFAVLVNLLFVLGEAIVDFVIMAVNTVKGLF